MPEPFSVTGAVLCPGCKVMVWFGPASALGAWFGAGLTVTVTLDGALAAPWLSVTTRVKV